jgi:flavin reductase (DIM6/NTAB) family NADH-FMN oxidoreductase RutF
MKLKKRRVWNRVDEQVYSISTIDSYDEVCMNIATYVVPVTMDIKRYMLAIYKNTKTHENIFKSTTNTYFVLQGLSINQLALVPILGKKSSIRYNKQKYLEKKDLLKSILFKEKRYVFLKHNAFSLLVKVEKLIKLGDHDLVVVVVEKVIENIFEKNLLTTNFLQDKNIIL